LVLGCDSVSREPPRRGGQLLRRVLKTGFAPAQPAANETTWVLELNGASSRLSADFTQLLFELGQPLCCIQGYLLGTQVNNRR